MLVLYILYYIHISILKMWAIVNGITVSAKRHAKLT